MSHNQKTKIENRSNIITNSIKIFKKRIHLPIQEMLETGSVPGLGRPPGGGNGNPL